MPRCGQIKLCQRFVGQHSCAATPAMLSSIAAGPSRGDGVLSADPARCGRATRAFRVLGVKTPPNRSGCLPSTIGFRVTRRPSDALSCPCQRLAVAATPAAWTTCGARPRSWPPWPGPCIVPRAAVRTRKPNTPAQLGAASWSGQRRQHAPQRRAVHVGPNTQPHPSRQFHLNQAGHGGRCRCYGNRRRFRRRHRGCRHRRPVRDLRRRQRLGPDFHRGKARHRRPRHLLAPGVEQPRAEVASVKLV